MNATSKLQQAIRTTGRRKDWLAAQIGVSPSYISHVLAGRRRFSPDQRRRVAEALGVSEQDLFYDDEPEADAA